MTDEDKQEPRHRKPGKARKRGAHTGGRHLRLVPPPVADADERPTPGAYPVPDLSAMSDSAIAMLVHRAGAEAAAGIPPLPHVVVTGDADSDTVTYHGPYDTGLEALTYARRMVEQNRVVDPRWTFTVTVAPLLPQ